MRPLSIRPMLFAFTLALAGAAQAAVVSTVPDSSGNFTVTDTTGPQAPEVFDFNIDPNTRPVPVIFYDTNPPSSQDPGAIADLIGSDYQVDPSLLAYVGGCDNIPGSCSGMTATSSTFALSGVPTFDYLALHFGGGELFFHWAQPITAMTLTAFDGFPGGLSNYRSYLSTPLPGALALFLSAMGFFGLRRKLSQPADSEPAAA